MGIMMSGGQRRTRMEATRVRLGGGQKASYATEPMVHNTELGPLPRPFLTTEALADAALRGTVRLETRAPRTEDIVPYLGGTTVYDAVDATLSMLEATTPAPDPRDATIFDDYKSAEEDM